MRRLTPSLLALVFASACAGGGEDLDPGPMQSDCASDHEAVGQEGSFVTLAHDVAGDARFVDDCTIELTSFTFDSGGVDVRFVIDADDEFADYRVISEDLRPDGPYEDETLTVPLPEGVTLDDVGALSVWCVPFGADFGHVSFASPL